MKNNLKHILVGALFVLSFGYGQGKKVEKADNQYNNLSYIDAIDSYEKLVKAGYTYEEIYKNLGNANFNNGRYKEASKWYKELLMKDISSIDPELVYKYALALKSLGEYKESDEWMNKFLLFQEQDNRAKSFRQNSDYLKNIKKISGRYSINKLPINSVESDFAPSYYNNELIFSTARDTGITSRNINEWDKKSFLSLYRTSLSDNGGYGEAARFSEALNTKAHESSTVFSKDGKVVYFTRNNSNNGKFDRDKSGISRLKIYRAELVNNKWINVSELPFNSEDYSVAHPALNKEESILYFSSDMPGTYGGSDIFKVAINTDGTYGEPVNMGPLINTEGRETFPYITDSGILYFASDGYPGLGGLDMFATRINDVDNYEVINLGAPINTPHDDFSFIFDETTKSGFFASNRDGNDEIYSLTEITPIPFNCKTIMNGIVVDAGNGEPISNARVVTSNDKGEKIMFITDPLGQFIIDGPCNKKIISVGASSEDYSNNELILKDAPIQDHKLTIKLNKKSIETVPIGTDLFVHLKLNPIYFDYNSSYIQKWSYKDLDKVVSYMKLHPTINVDVRSYTDSRGTDKYNMWLSNRRAKRTMDYLISEGIDKQRLSGKGYGELEIKNECTDGVRCSDKLHEENRRSEFIIIE